MGTHYRGTADEVRALDSYIKLMRAADSIAARIERLLKVQGLTISQFGVLEALYHLGPMCQRQLGTKLLKSNGNITTVAENLERRELIRRVRSEEDRRFVTVHLTERGEGLIREIFPGHVRTIQGEMNHLSPSDLEELGRLCRELGRATAREHARTRPATGAEEE